jgi:hypothetical protein
MRDQPNTTFEENDGNPCDAQDVLQLVSALTKEDNRTREPTHALPILHTEMELLDKYFKETIPDDDFSDLQKLQLRSLFTLCFVCFFRLDDDALALKVGFLKDVKRNRLVILNSIKMHKVFRTWP